MILVARNDSGQDWGKPRASGDDPDVVPLTRTDGYVNPARAGMILDFQFPAPI